MEKTQPQLSQLRAKEGHGESRQGFADAEDLWVGWVTLMQEYHTCL